MVFSLSLGPTLSCARTTFLSLSVWEILWRITRLCGRLDSFIPVSFALNWCMWFCNSIKGTRAWRIVSDVTIEMEGTPFGVFFQVSRRLRKGPRSLRNPHSTTASLSAPMIITLGGVVGRCLADKDDRRVRRAAQWPSARWWISISVFVTNVCEDMRTMTTGTALWCAMLLLRCASSCVPWRSISRISCANKEYGEISNDINEDAVRALRDLQGIGLLRRRGRFDKSDGKKQIYAFHTKVKRMSLWRTLTQRQWLQSTWTSTVSLMSCMNCRLDLEHLRSTERRWVMQHQDPRHRDWLDVNRGSIPNVLLCWRSDAVTARCKPRRASACPDYISPVPAVCAELAPVVGCITPAPAMSYAAPAPVQYAATVYCGTLDVLQQPRIDLEHRCST